MTEIRPLTGLRGVFAAWVVLGHFWIPAVQQLPDLVELARPALAGSLAVDMFFVLSGFIITYIYGERMATFSWAAVRDFWRHRFARIYPVYALSMALVIAFAVATQRLADPPIPSVVIERSSIIRNALFLQSSPGGIVINPPAWSLPGEVAAYALFPVLVLAVVRIPTSWMAFGLAAAIAIAGSMLIAVTWSDDFGYPLYELSWMRAGWAFPAGCLVARGWVLMADRGRSQAWDVVAAVGVLGMFAAVMTGDPGPTFYLPLAALPFLCLIVVGCAGATGWVARALSGRAIVWGGRISYSVYLTHYVVAYAYDKIVERRDVATAPWPVRVAGLVLAIAVVVALGATVYHLVEEPARRAISRRRRVAPVTSAG
ncbi:acyltransferase [Aeromicrobium sp. NPDC092404]|uniref:acyltransferase family protein n=1 Tax=Aeromicrobium sp. NPDC092404 TaxID=3154976 RepID=UPI0034297241